MSIVSISQLPFSGSETVANELAVRLGYHRVDREVVLAASQNHGLRQTEFLRVVEGDVRWWCISQGRLEAWTVILKAVICEAVQKGDVVYDGPFGHELLPDHQSIIKVHVMAPLQSRIAQARKQLSLSEVAAERYIRYLDNLCGRRLKLLFGSNPGDSARYSLVLNTSLISTPTVIDLVANLARHVKATNSEVWGKSFQDYTIAAKVDALLVGFGKGRSAVHLEVRNGVVRLTGFIPTEYLIDELIGSIRKLDGVRRVEHNFEFLSLDTGYP